MKKYLWIVLIVLIVIFWVGNYIVVNYALTKLIGGIMAVALPVALCFIDSFLILGFVLPGDGEVATILYGCWLLVVFFNSLLVSLAVFMFTHAFFELVILPGVIFFILRAALFVLAPTYLLYK